MSVHKNLFSRLAPLIAVLLILVFISSPVTGCSPAPAPVRSLEYIVDKQATVSEAPAAIPTAIALTVIPTVAASTAIPTVAPASPEVLSATPQVPGAGGTDRSSTDSSRGIERGSLVALPKSIRFPSVGAATEIEQVGATADGGMDVPSDPARAGWYRYGPRPGAAGNAAIAGHVDWAGKLMPFWHLNLLKSGDPVEILTADGRTFNFVVRWSRWYDAEDAPATEIFASSGTPEVTLVTCGGAFDPKTRDYSLRLVVRASQASDK